MSIKKVCDKCGAEEGKVTSIFFDVSLAGGSLTDGTWETLNRGHLCKPCLKDIQDYSGLPHYTSSHIYKKDEL